MTSAPQSSAPMPPAHGSPTGTPTIGYSYGSESPSPSESACSGLVPTTYSKPSGSPSPSVSVAGYA